jgi:tetratricopeptide (TPR) repeat protein
MIVFFKKACLLAGFLLLVGCQSTPQADRLRQHGFSSLPPSHTIDAVPFYPQEQFYCGPTTLSEVFGYYKNDIPPNDIAPKMFIPDKEGSLQLEMITATRQYGFLPYSARGTLSSIMALVSDNIPVIVFQNLSIQLLPQWHYAVVTGFDSEKGTVTLHTGVTPYHEMSFELFERTWARGNYWYLAPVPPNVTSSEMVPFSYTSAAYDMLKVGDKPRALAFLETATKQWPKQWLAYFLLANHFMKTDESRALQWFEKGFDAGQNEPAYLHNFIILLYEMDDKPRANALLTDAITRFPNNKALKILAEKHGVTTAPHEAA